MLKRVDGLDWQRGLLAFSIMIYHLLFWELSEPDASTFIGRLGVYGVSMFFVLSGLSMAIVYNTYICGIRSSCYFLARRIFRIWPLLWVAVITISIINISRGKNLDYGLVVLNLTTLFGFFSPGSYMNTGAWSIGNEMVYYALTPFLLVAYNKKIIYGNIITIIATSIGFLFAFKLLTTEQSLADQWGYYINPFNNLFLYCAGVSIYYNLTSLEFNKISIALCFILSVCIFIFYPAKGDQIRIVTNWERIIFCFGSILLVISFYKNNCSVPARISSSLTQLGIATYGVYLLHPIIYQIISFILKKISGNHETHLTILLTILLTITTACISYKIFEAPLINLGKKITSA